jgi:hypothetical protein
VSPPKISLEDTPTKKSQKPAIVNFYAEMDFKSLMNINKTFNDQFLAEMKEVFSDQILYIISEQNYMRNKIVNAVKDISSNELSLIYFELSELLS